MHGGCAHPRCSHAGVLMCIVQDGGGGGGGPLPGEQEEQEEEFGEGGFVLRKVGRPGQLAKIQLIDFMCHRNFEVELG